MKSGEGIGYFVLLPFDIPDIRRVERGSLVGESLSGNACLRMFSGQVLVTRIAQKKYDETSYSAWNYR